MLKRIAKYIPPPLKPILNRFFYMPFQRAVSMFLHPKEWFIMFWMRPPKYSEESPINFFRSKDSIPDSNINQCLRLIGKPKAILDFGCGTGMNGIIIKESNPEVGLIGIDINNILLKEAELVYDRVFLMNLEEEGDDDLLSKLGKQVDVILAIEVLEHLARPLLVLKSLTSCLKPDGIIYITTPNIAHWQMRLRLLRGDFGPDFYVLDPTHLRFFTLRSLTQMLSLAGLKIDYLGGVPFATYARSKFEVTYIDYHKGYVRRLSQALIKIRPSLFTGQFVVVASKMGK